MKILFIVDEFPKISETFVLNQVSGMIDMGHDVRVISTKSTETVHHEAYSRYNMSQISVSLDKFMPKLYIKRLFNIVPFWLKVTMAKDMRFSRMISPEYRRYALSLRLSYLARWCHESRWRPDAVISHFGHNGVYAEALAHIGALPAEAKRTTIFHAYEICKLDKQQITHRYHRLFNGYDVLLPVNALWQRRLISAGAPAQLTSVMHMGVDVDEFAFSCPKGSLNIVAVGRLTEKKGFEPAIKALALMRDRRPDIEFDYTIIGDGQLREHLQAIVEGLGLIRHVHFIGAKTQEYIKKAVSEADVFMLTSVTGINGDMEGIPVSLMEAMSMGKICISSYHSGIPELIDHGVDGLLCQEYDVEAIADALIRVSEMSEAQLGEMSRKARAKVEHSFNSKSLIAELDHLLRRPNV